MQFPRMFNTRYMTHKNEKATNYISNAVRKFGSASLSKYKT